MILYYFVLGTLLAIAGALPLGTVNLAVIRTTVRENTKNALYIITAAGIGEVFLATIVLMASMEISAFLEKNSWIHFVILLLFLGIGSYLLIFKKRVRRNDTYSLPNNTFSKYVTGLSLSIINPPVLGYWIAAIAISNNYITELNMNTSILLLILFFIGVYVGKTLTLYLYSLWGSRISKKSNTPNQKINRIIGAIFIALSAFQGIKLWLL